MERFINLPFTSWDYENVVGAGKYLDQVEKQFINDFLQDHEPYLCLDISCGSGRHTIPLLNKGLNVVACDLDYIQIQKLSTALANIEIRNDLINILQTDAHYLPFKNSACEVIFSFQTVGYLDHTIFFSECNRILKKNGFLLFNEANNKSYKAIAYNNKNSDGQFYRKSHSEICSMLIDNGFRIKKVIGMNWLPISRSSNARWIPLASKIERIFKLRFFPSISPWVLYLAEKDYDLKSNILR